MLWVEECIAQSFIFNDGAKRWLLSETGYRVMALAAIGCSRLRANGLDPFLASGLEQNNSFSQWNEVSVV